jgi:hypothetical protein
MSLHFFPTAQGGINAAQIFYIRRLPTRWRLIRPGTTTNTPHMDHITDEEVDRWSKDMPDGWLEIVDVEKLHVLVNMNMVGWYAAQSEPDDLWRYHFSPIILTGSWTIMIPEFSVLLRESSLSEAIASSCLTYGRRIRLGVQASPSLSTPGTSVSGETDDAVHRPASSRRSLWRK